MILQRLVSLFRRYAACHLRLTLPGRALTDEAGKDAGHLDHLHLQGSRLIAEGWTTAPAVSLALGAGRVDVVPDLPRADVARARPDLDLAAPGFALGLAMDAGKPMLSLNWPGRQIIHGLDLPRPRIARARRRLWLPFLRDLCRAVPALAHWVFTGDPADRGRVKRCLQLDEGAAPPCLQRLIFLEDSLAALPDAQRCAERTRLRPARLANHEVTIILPVYNAKDLLEEALDRVLQHTDLPWRLILIDDASTDPAMRPFLRAWADKASIGSDGKVILIELDRNAGFIGAVNAGLEKAISLGRNVVLLNSDAFVPKGWASRLMRPFLAHENVASVTPMSNDAEILTVPVISRGTPLSPGEAYDLDHLARQFHPDAGLTDAPTGVGFCMAMSIDYLHRVPRLDQAFGRGYGEEVDWCRKVKKLGGRHLALPSLFVEHRGGSSFGSAEKLRLIKQNNTLIAKRYPEFDSEVQGFVRGDPLATPRLVLGIALAALRARGRLPIYLAHSLGGGAEDYLAGRLRADVATTGAGAAIVLRVGGANRWGIELHMPEGITCGGTNDFGFVRRMLDPVAAREIIYSCGVGDPAPDALPDLLISLKRSANDRIEVLFHDFLPISPSYTLLDADGRYRGLPDPDGTDEAHRRTHPDGSRKSLRQWQKDWGRLIASADVLTVFSRDSRRIVCGAYGLAARKLRLVPHRMPSDIVPCQVRPDARPVIGVLGNIGRQKGAAVLADLSHRLARHGAVDLALIGNLDPAFALASGARVHGSYQRADIAGLVARYGINRWLIPSVWPETFSFTTHEALATGLPVWCFDLGAQAEAVRAAVARGKKGGTLALRDGIPDLDEMVAMLCGDSAPALPERVSA